jgi:glycosyltransferase involved in cell wall biosynthesis
MKLSLIIPAYNEERYIGDCIDSVLTHGGSDISEIIVVDNASTDRTSEIAASKPGVRVVYEAKKGLPAARECGRLAASGDLIAYIDADSRLHPKWLPLVNKVFSSRPEVVSLSGPAHYWDATFWQRTILGLSWWVSSPLMYRIVGYMIFGAHFVVRREALQKIGGFDKSITFYGEDTDLARRLSTQGKVLYRMDFFIMTSARRFVKEGILKSNFTYTMNFIWPILFHKPYTLTHQDIREDAHPSQR